MSEYKTDWEKVRKWKISDDRPPEWPEGIRAISTQGLSLLGINEQTGELYWDGRKLVTERTITLGSFERLLAGLAAFATFGVFAIEAGRSLGLWGG